MESITRNPQTAMGQGDGAEWVNPENALITDGVFAGVGAAIVVPVTSQDLWLLNYDFNIPPGSLVYGAEAKIVRKAQGGGDQSYVRDVTVQLIQGGYPIPDCENKASLINWNKDALREDVFGGESDLWGTALSDTIVNAWDFGLVVSCAAADQSVPAFGTAPHIDGVTLTLWYEPAASSIRMTDPYGGIIYN